RSGAGPPSRDPGRGPASGTPRGPGRSAEGFGRGAAVRSALPPGGVAPRRPPATAPPPAGPRQESAHRFDLSSHSVRGSARRGPKKRDAGGTIARPPFRIVLGGGQVFPPPNSPAPLRSPARSGARRARATSLPATKVNPMFAQTLQRWLRRSPRPGKKAN